MAGDGVLFVWDDKDVQAMIAKSIGHIQDMTPVMKSFAEYMVNRTADRFEKETGPDGKKWQKLSPLTLARKARMKSAINKILQQDGYLRLVHPKADKDSAGIYSDRIYAAIHNRGGKAGRGHKVTIPKREFLGFNEADFKEFEETCKDWIISGRRP